MLLFISNRLEEFLTRFETAPAGLLKYLSSGILLGTADREPLLIDKRELNPVQLCFFMMLSEDRYYMINMQCDCCCN